MSGLEKIISTIDSQAAASIEEINTETAAETRELIANAQQEGEQRYNAIVEGTKAKCAAELSAAKTQAAARVNQKLLQGKVELLNETIDKALEKLHDMADADFTELIIGIAGASIAGKSGEMCLNAHCLKKLPADFEAQLGRRVGGKVALCSSPEDIGDGFILRSGLIEVNCTFEAIVEANRQELEDAVCRMLFA